MAEVEKRADESKDTEMEEEREGNTEVEEKDEEEKEVETKKAKRCSKKGLNEGETTPIPIERPSRERKTVERYSEPALARSTPKGLSIQKVLLMSRRITFLIFCVSSRGKVLN